LEKADRYLGKFDSCVDLIEVLGEYSAKMFASFYSLLLWRSLDLFGRENSVRLTEMLIFEGNILEFFV
jgi:hypothetical protein